MAKKEGVIKKMLLTLATEIYNNSKSIPASKQEFTKVEHIDKQLRDLKNSPYMFVLACVMDRQIQAERAWSIPHQVCDYFKVKTFVDLAAVPESKIVAFFTENNIHRYDETMGHCFYDAVQRIKNVYDGDASKIWEGKPSSATVIYRFLCFNGVGIKIATMATNILSRDLGVELSDLSAIDVSPDVQVCRILYRLGLAESEDREAAIYKAKEINPPFPGIIDLACWQWGREFCHPSNPECGKCPMNSVCEKQGL